MKFLEGFTRVNNIKQLLRDHWLFIVLLILSSITLSGNFLSSDEGTILNGAWKLFNGQRIYVDFFSFIAPGSYAITLLSFLTLGATYASAKLFSLLFFAAASYCLYKTSCLVWNNRNTANITAILWFTASVFNPITINHNTYGVYAACIALYFFISALSTKKSLYLLLSGLSVGSVILILQTSGAVLIGIMSCVFIYYTIRRSIHLMRLLSFFVGVSIPLSILFYFFKYSLLLENLFLWPLNHYSTVNTVSPIPLYAAFLIFCMAMFYIKKHYKISNEMVTISILYISLLFVGSLGRTDISHILWNGFPLFILISPLITSIMGSGTLRKAFPGVAIKEIVVSIFIAAALTTLIASFNSYKHIFQESIRRLGITTFYAHPFLPGFYFQFGRPDPYPYDILLTGMHTREMFFQQLMILEKNNPRFVFVNYTLAKKFGYSKNNELDEYISQHYTGITNIGTVTIMKNIYE